MSSSVTVIGGGPVGLTLSLILARYGIRTVVLEARDSPTPLDESRAIAWMPRGLELLDWLGVYEIFAAHAVSRVRHEFWSAGRPRLRLPIDKVDSPHPHTLDLPQHWSEALMEAAARETGLVDVRRGCQVVSAVQSPTGTEVEIEAHDGSRTTLEAPWAAVCDGYRSATRQALRIATEHRDYGADAVVADFQLEQDLLPPGTSKIELNPDRPCGLFRFGADRWRVVYRVNRGEDRDAMSEERMARRILAQLAPKAQPGRFLWASAFRLAQQQSTSYRRGRFVLVGDAAHGMGPSAGAGMQVGVLGAWRLGWRLALAAGGHHLAEVLIDDYAREQRAGSAQVQTENMLIFRNMALRSQTLATLRKSLLSLADRIPGAKRRMVKSLTLVGQHVPTSKAADRPRLTLQTGSETFVRSLGEWREGHRIPQPIQGSQPSSLSSTGRQHRIIPFSGSPERSLALAKQILSCMPVPACIVEDPCPDHGRAAVAVVRPDQEVVALVCSSRE